MGELSAVQSFIDASAAARSEEQLAGLLDDMTHRLGFDFFAMVHHVDLARRDEHSSIAIWSYPQTWVDEYLSRGLATVDPVHIASQRTNVGFLWTDIPHLISLTPSHRKVREQTVRAGISDGFTVPANVPGEANGSCSFAVAKGREIPMRSRSRAQLVGSFAFQAARTLIGRSEQPPPHPRLTPRQLDCVVLVGRGKTDGEIATILGIAEDTVTEHVDAARERYDVPRRVQLVTRAIFDGQIALTDVLS